MQPLLGEENGIPGETTLGAGWDKGCPWVCLLRGPAHAQATRFSGHQNQAPLTRQLQQQKCMSQGSGSRKSKMKVLAGWLPSEAERQNLSHASLQASGVVWQPLVLLGF